MKMAKNQRMLANNIKNPQAAYCDPLQANAGVNKKTANKTSVNVGLEAAGPGGNAQHQHKQARTPNMSQKASQRQQPLKECRNHSSSSKDLKSVQHRKLASKKGQAAGQSSRHPNKPNHTRIAHRSRERGDPIRLMDDVDQMYQPQAPPASSTPDMDINKMAKKYKKMRKAGEHQGGRTVIGMSSHVPARSQPGDLSGGRDQVQNKRKRPQEANNGLIDDRHQADQL